MKQHDPLDSTTAQLCTELVDSGLKVHRVLGPGLLESTYEQCLAHELGRRGIPVARQIPLPITYEGLQLDAAYRLDLLVADRVVVEVKATERLAEVHQAQLLTYLRLSGWRVGFLMNFHVVMFRHGLRRMLL